jgi:hypothetical protein
MLSTAMLNVVMLCVIMLYAVLLNNIMLNVIMLSVVAPNKPECLFKKRKLFRDRKKFNVEKYKKQFSEDFSSATTYKALLGEMYDRKLQ